jgi:hypothetical protein
VLVTVNPLPTVGAGIDTVLCLGQDYILNGNVTGNGNVAFGLNACGVVNTTGNSGFGYSSCESVTSGIYNTTRGLSSLAKASKCS